MDPNTGLLGQLTQKSTSCGVTVASSGPKGGAMNVLEQNEKFMFAKSHRQKLGFRLPDRNCLRRTKSRKTSNEIFR